MLKPSVLPLILISLLPLSSFATMGSLSCESVSSLATDLHLKVESQLYVPGNKLLNIGNTSMLIEPVVTALSHDSLNSEVTQVGRRDLLKSDRIDSANSVRFKLDRLIEASSFGNFTPGDGCIISLSMPGDGFAQSTFEVKADLACTQGRKSQVLKCASALTQ